MNGDSTRDREVVWSGGAAAALYVAAAVKACATTTFWWVIPVYVHRLTGGERDVVTNLLVFALPQVGGFILAHAVGGLIDLTGRIKVFILLALTVQTLTCVVLLFVGTPLWIVLSVGVGVAFNITLNTTLKTYATRARENEHGRALGALDSASSVGWFAGGVVVSFFFVSPEPSAIRALLIADLVLMGLAIAAVVILLPRTATLGVSPSQPGTHSRAAAIVAELRALYSHRMLAAAGIAGLVVGIGNWTYVANYGVFVTVHLGAPERTVGLISAASAFTSALGGWLIGRFFDRYGPVPTLRLGALAYLAAYVLFVAWPTVPAAFLVFMTPAYIAILVGLTGLAARLGGIAHRGGGVGIVDALWAAAIGMGAVIGAAVGRVDLGLLPGTACVLIGLGAVLTWVLLPARKTLQPGWEPPAVR